MLPLKQHLQTELFEGTVRLARILFWRSMPYTLLFVLLTGLLILYPLGSLFGEVGLGLKELKSGLNGDMGEFVRSIKKTLYQGDGFRFIILLSIMMIIRDIFVSAPIFRKLQKICISDIEKDSIYDKTSTQAVIPNHSLRDMMIILGGYSILGQLLDLAGNLYLNNFAFFANFLFLMLAMKFAAAPGFVLLEGKDLTTALKESFTRLSWFSAWKCALMFYLVTIFGAVILFLCCLFVGVTGGFLTTKVSPNAEWMVHSINGLLVFGFCILFINTCVCVVSSFMTTLYYRLSHDPD